MKKIIRLTESDLIHIVKTVINEQVEPNAGSIQKFLQLNQDNSIVVDYNFGNKTATAVGKYLFKAFPSSKKYSGITTLKQLWQVMKDNGNDVGSKPGFGPKMAGAVSRALIAASKELEKKKVSSSSNQKQKPNPLTPKNQPGFMDPVLKSNQNIKASDKFIWTKESDPSKHPAKGWMGGLKKVANS